jgi:rhodanese-related sulfurtransferase
VSDSSHGPPFAEIDVRSAAARLSDYRVVDVRGRDEFEGPLGHVPGSELVPTEQLCADAPALGERPLLLVCRSGRRSGLACQALIARGFPAVTNLAGGMIAWNEAGLPVEGKSET